MNILYFGLQKKIAEVGCEWQQLALVCVSMALSGTWRGVGAGAGEGCFEGGSASCYRLHPAPRPQHERNQYKRVAGVAGSVFLSSLAAFSFQVSRQCACAACAPPLLPRAPARRAPGCPRCATLPGPQGLPGLPRPPTVPRRSGSQSPWHLPSARRPAPIPQPSRRKPGSYLENSH